MTTFLGLMIPFVGTSLGAACVFFLKNEIKDGVQRMLLGFASGVMIAASVWSLLIPSVEMSESMGKWSVLPAVVGFLFGILFLFAMDRLTPHLHLGESKAEGPESKLSNTVKLMLAVTIHNIPEGMAVGVVFAGMLSGNSGITVAAAFSLALGIAIQNFPEGAIISLPFRSEGNTRLKSFLFGVLSGVVEPIAAVITILLTGLMEKILPYCLSFAAGAMIYVVIEELIPEGTSGGKTDICTIGFAVGFLIMMVLDNVL